MYFCTRLLVLDERRLRHLVVALLVATFPAVLNQTFAFFTGHDYIWHSPRGGPIEAGHDAASYFPFWPALYLYGAVLALRYGCRRLAYLSLADVVFSLLTASATLERSGVVGALFSLVPCFGSRAMRRFLWRGVVIILPLFLIWLSTPAGQHLLERFREPDPMFRRRLYVEKSLRYMASPAWNPLFGTGFARLADLAGAAYPEDRWVWDAGRQEWREAKKIIRHRPIHCAPVTLLGEYGVVGALLLASLFLALVMNSLRLLFGAPRLLRAPPDRTLILALWGAAGAVIFNSPFHNTDTVAPLLCYCWSFAGLIMGHPRAFAYWPRSDDKPPLASRRGRRPAASSSQS
ncbi:MAG: hypothetical protein J7M26_01210 [Armatimonadetes bacterium]|nr:hypothetical protein [Armatimonadota bacterium]